MLMLRKKQVREAKVTPKLQAGKGYCLNLFLYQGTDLDRDKCLEFRGRGGEGSLLQEGVDGFSRRNQIHISRECERELEMRPEDGTEASSWACASRPAGGNDMCGSAGAGTVQKGEQGQIIKGLEHQAKEGRS